MPFKITLVLLLFVFQSGCFMGAKSSISPADKERSMKRFDDLRLNLYFGETNVDVGKGLSVQDYIQKYTSEIYGADAFSEDSVVIDETETPVEGGVLIETDIEIQGLSGGRSGHAVAISPYGLFLTAAHVVDSPDSRIVVRAFKSGTGELRSRVHRFRKVFVDEEFDVAVIKVDDIVTPLRIRVGRHVAQGDDVFTANAMNGGASHGVVTAVLGSDTDLIRKVLSTLPTMSGDSGSPVIDKEGRLIGVHSGGRREGAKRSALCVYIDERKLREILFEDDPKVKALKEMLEHSRSLALVDSSSANRHPLTRKLEQQLEDLRAEWDLPPSSADK